MGSSSFLGTAASLSFSRIVLLPGSVVIPYLHVVGVAFLPAEADPPLVVDPNAVLPGTVPFQRLQAIAGRNGKIMQGSRAVEIRVFFSGSAIRVSAYRSQSSLGVSIGWAAVAVRDPFGRLWRPENETGKTPRLGRNISVKL